MEIKGELVGKRWH